MDKVIVCIETLLKHHREELFQYQQYYKTLENKSDYLSEIEKDRSMDIIKLKLDLIPTVQATLNHLRKTQSFKGWVVIFDPIFKSYRIIGHGVIFPSEMTENIRPLIPRLI